MALSSSLTTHYHFDYLTMVSMKMVDYPMSFISPSGVAELNLGFRLVNINKERVIKILTHLTVTDETGLYNL